MEEEKDRIDDFGEFSVIPLRQELLTFLRECNDECVCQLRYQFVPSGISLEKGTEEAFIDGLLDCLTEVGLDKDHEPLRKGILIDEIVGQVNCYLLE